jgi:hypothetical protein
VGWPSARGKGDLEICHSRIGKPLELIGIQEVVLGVTATEEQDRLPDRGSLLFEVGPLPAGSRGKGPTPVPAPTMIIGRCGLAGGWNGMVGLRTNVNTVLPSMLASK